MHQLHGCINGTDAVLSYVCVCVCVRVREKEDHNQKPLVTGMVSNGDDPLKLDSDPLQVKQPSSCTKSHP